MGRIHRLLALVFVFLVSSSLTIASDRGLPAEDERVLGSAGVGADGESLLAFFRDRTPSAAEHDRLRDLLRRLGDDDFATRDKAARDLAALGPAFVGPLRRALRGETDVEVV